MDSVIIQNPPVASAWSGWRPVSNSTPASLALLMDEEFAKDLDQREKVAVHQTAPTQVDSTATITEVAAPAAVSADDDTASDHLLAVALQTNYDLEHDTDLRALEKHMNGNSRVSVSLSKYNRAPPDADQWLDDEDDDYEEDDHAWTGSAPRSRDGSGGGGGGGGRRKKHARGSMATPTKHDLIVSGQKNAQAAEDNLPPDMHVGDLSRCCGSQLSFSNKTYNELVKFSHQGRQRNARDREASDHATQAMSLDAPTVRLLKGLVTNDRISELGGIISTGKEATVYHAFGPLDADEEMDELIGDEDDECAEKMPEKLNNAGSEPATEYAIKIFKTTLTDFKTRDRYIRGDMRFKDRLNNQNPRKVVHVWAEKEMRNLSRLHKAGLPVPEPIYLKDHVLIMTFVGRGSVPAPQLRDARLNSAQLKKAYEQSVMLMARMYRDCNLIHADFSQYNLLWQDNRLYVIDVSQAVEPWHEDAMKFFHRDVTNLTNYFRKAGVRNVSSVRDIMTDVTGYEVDAHISDQQFLEEMTRLADQSGKAKRGFDGFESVVPEESFTEMFERGTVENARARAEKVARRLIEEENTDSGEEEQEEEEEEEEHEEEEEEACDPANAVV